MDDRNKTNKSPTGDAVTNDGSKDRDCEKPAGAPVEGQQTATFAGGCFWGVEELFRTLDGVISTCVGYTGGTATDPSYEDVCEDKTGHAEAVRIVYDPARISYERLLGVFWDNHNPTTPNRQGPDVGTQYRSAIFYHDEAQQQAASTSRDALAASGRFKDPIVTQIVPASTFYAAEEYHQQYLAKRGQSSCHIR